MLGNGVPVPSLSIVVMEPVVSPFVQPKYLFATRHGIIEDDLSDTVRFGLYPGDGQGLLEYVPAAPGSGHPSFSPDGRWICTDGAGEGTRSTVVLCDPGTGRVRVAADYEAVSDGYASFKAIDQRAPGETVIQALNRASSNRGKVWQTQAHPAWSRDGSAIIFNADLGQGSQLYVLDVARTLQETR